MTKEKTKELIAKAMERIALMQAYVDGKQIQFFSILENKWVDTIDPSWLQGNRYRIKPEPNYRPFKNAEECWQEMQKHQPFGWLKDTDNGGYIIISALDGEDIEISSNNGWDYVGLMKCYTFADGTPFGVKEE